MATASRTENADVNASVIERMLRQNPCRFAFFQAFRLLLQTRPDREPVGRFVNPEDEVVRFRGHNVLTFPASEIQEVDWTNEDQPHMTVNFMGLAGLLGVLPYTYTELLIERKLAKDESLAAFFDIFNHRIISLFYQAWEKYRFFIAYERGERDRLSRHLLSVIGLGTDGLQDRQQVLDDSLLYYSGLLSQQPKTAIGLEQLLSDYFGVPVEVEQFAGGWYRLDSSIQCQFEEGDTYSEQLGYGAVVGDEIWDQKSRVRVKIGPLSLAQYLDFLPDGAAYAPLRALTRFYSNDEFEFEAQLILEHQAVPRCEIGSEGDTAPRLGWVTWMKSAPFPSDADQTTLQL